MNESHHSNYLLVGALDDQIRLWPCGGINLRYVMSSVEGDRGQTPNGQIRNGIVCDDGAGFNSC